MQALDETGVRAIRAIKALVGALSGMERNGRLYKGPQLGTTLTHGHRRQLGGLWQCGVTTTGSECARHQLGGLLQCRVVADGREGHLHQRLGGHC